MKNILAKYLRMITTLVLLSGITILNAQTFSLLDPGFEGVAGSVVSWGDYDNDGDLDVFLTGATQNTQPYTPRSKIYRNDGANVFTEIGPIAGQDSIFPGIAAGSANWVDYDNDGDLDMFMTGGDFYSTVDVMLYRNQGNGSFSQVLIAFASVYWSSTDWGDYDNDGDLDLLMIGTVYAGTKIVRLYRNDNNDTFNMVSVNLPGMQFASAEWGDYDNDGDLDILCSGIDSNEKNVTEIYKNDGSGNFSPLNLGIPGLGTGKLQWGDYDSDGDLDFVVIGEDSLFQKSSRIYRNDGMDVFTDINAGLMPLFGGAVGWGDLDNDGDLDLLISGAANTIFPIVPHTRIYRNDGGDSFSVMTTGIMDLAYFNSVDWGDFDNDGDLDILYSGEDSASVKHTVIYINESIVANTIPTAPQNLSSQQDSSSNRIRLDWDQSTDIETNDAGLTYNVRVGSYFDSIDIVTPMADISTGVRLISNKGNADNRIFALYDLPYGTYFWSVQSIDNAYAGSPFSVTDTFEVVPFAYFITENDTICAFDSVEVSYTANASDSAVYNWDFDGGIVLDGTGQGPFVLYWDSAGTKTITLTVTDGGIVSTPFSTEIYINPLPVVDIGADIFSCDEDLTEISAVSSQGTPPYSFLWSYGTGTDSVVQIVPPTDMMLYVSITDQQGCKSTDSIYVSVSKPFQQEEICLVTVDTETNKNMIIWEKTPNAGIEKYYIYKESSTNYYNLIDSVLFDSMSVYIDYSSTPEVHSDKYKISVVDTCSNESDLSFYHKTINLTVSQGSPQTTFVLWWELYEDESGLFIPSMYYIYRGTDLANLTLHDSVTGSSTSYNDNNVTQTYFYRIGIVKEDACIPTSIDKAQGGPYANSFSNMDDNVIDNSINENVSGILMVYPNPANGKVVIEIDVDELRSYTLSLKNITGSTIRYIDKITDRQVVLDIDGLASGIYLLEMNGTKTYRARVVID